MPYLIKDARKKYEYALGNLLAIDFPGELNYLITELCVQYVQHNKLNYDSINDVIGALECAKQEFYRRVAAPYEDKKIKENGDVY